MIRDDFPALFACSDDASNKYQSLYLTLVIAEYSALIVAAILSMPLFEGDVFYLLYALLFLALIAILLTRSFWKLQDYWYRSRALAESAKTLSYRYIMRASPFEDGAQPAPRDAFTAHLQQLISANRATVGRISPDSAAKAQITDRMEAVRSLNLDQRKALYLNDRIHEQRTWYVKKAVANREAAKKWVIAGVVAYAIGAALALSRLEWPEPLRLRMVNERDRWCAAQQLIRQHGDAAEMDAAAKADAAIAAGDSKGESLWLDVLNKIRALQRTDPNANELN